MEFGGLYNNEKKLKAPIATEEPFRVKCSGMSTEDVYNLFYQGKYQEVVSATLDAPGKQIEAKQVPPVVASLTFLGRIDESEMVYERFSGKLSVLEGTMCRFFLGVVKCRHFHFKAARKYFGDNILIARRAELPDSPSDREKIRFYLFQGVGFYRYTYGHLRPALRWAKKAYEASFKGDYLFGRLFSQDLLAHVEINFGKTHAGLKLIEQNINLAQAMGRDAIVQMSKVTRVIYRSRFGISAKDSIEELLSTLSETTFEDGYSRACLLAELSHQYLLRGNAVKAKETLNSACEYVYRIENLRLEILLNFRIAVMLSQQGELSQALHLVRGSLKRLEEKVDRHLELKLKGLEHKLLGKLGNLEQCEDLSKEIYELTRRTGYFTAERIWGRASGCYLSSEVRLQDPLGDMFDDIVQGNQDLIQEVIERNWLGLLYPLCKVDVTAKTLLLGLSGKSLTVFDQGNVYHFPRGASNQVSKFLVVLSQGRKTKEQIINEVWQEKYHPLRHDPLLYTLISKLRKELGSQAMWVEATQEGYEIQTGIIVREFEKTIKSGHSHLLETSESPLTYEDGLLELNFRQQQIVSLARKSSYIDVKALGEAFQVSPATANRDLAFLEELGWLIRTGKGRATRYHFGRKDEKHESH